MEKDVAIFFKINSDLKRDFFEKAEINCQTPAMILRKMIDEYLNDGIDLSELKFSKLTSDSTYTLRIPSCIKTEFAGKLKSKADGSVSNALKLFIQSYLNPKT